MSVVLTRDRERPGLHALVIGVGGYPHCGPTGPHDVLRKVKPLTSPPHSAAAMARLLVEQFVEVQPFPLRSLQLLTNEPEGIEGWKSPELLPGWTPSPPTFPEIKTAFDRLWNEASRHPSNALLVFFSGHGVQRTDWTLLAEDLGSNAADPLLGAIDISETRRGAYRCAARTQLWLIDACRENATSLDPINHVTGEPLARALAVDTSGLDSTFLASTTDFALAGGDRNTPSRFTKAIMAALAGLAAHPENGQWNIATGGLQKAVNSVLRRQREEKPHLREQQCELLGGTGTHILLNGVSPLVPTRITCEPPEYLPNVDLTLRDCDGVVHRRAGAPDTPLHAEARAGFGKVSATPTAGHIPSKEIDAFIAPPETRESVRW